MKKAIQCDAKRVKILLVSRAVQDLCAGHTAKVRIDGTN